LAAENKLKRTVYRNAFLGDTVTIRDPKANIVQRSSDSKYRCNNGSVPYRQTIAQRAPAPAIFVSEALLNQIGEQMIRLEQIRRSCGRLLATYNFQLALLPNQDQQAAAQKAVQYLSAKVENENIAPNTTVNTDLNSVELTQFGLTAPANGTLKVADALVTQRNLSTLSAEQIRTQTKAQTIDVEYRKQFDDAQSAIDAQLREIAHSLLILDSAVVATPDTVVRQYYETGAWVQKGSAVLLTTR
jgi:hypothetical protein